MNAEQSKAIAAAPYLHSLFHLFHSPPWGARRHHGGSGGGPAPCRNIPLTGFVHCRRNRCGAAGEALAAQLIPFTAWRAAVCRRRKAGSWRSFARFAAQSRLRALAEGTRRLPVRFRSAGGRQGSAGMTLMHRPARGGAKTRSWARLGFADRFRDDVVRSHDAAVRWLCAIPIVANQP